MRCNFASVIDPVGEAVHRNDPSAHLCITHWTLHTWSQHAWGHVHRGDAHVPVHAACARGLIMHHVPSGRLVSASGRRQQHRGSVIKKLLLRAEAPANAHVHRHKHTHTPTMHRHRIKIGKLRKNSLVFVPAADVAATPHATVSCSTCAVHKMTAVVFSNTAKKKNKTTYMLRLVVINA